MAWLKSEWTSNVYQSVILLSSFGRRNAINLFTVHKVLCYRIYYSGTRKTAIVFGVSIVVTTHIALSIECVFALWKPNCFGPLGQCVVDDDENSNFAWQNFSINETQTMYNDEQWKNHSGCLNTFDSVFVEREAENWLIEDEICCFLSTSFDWVKLFRIGFKNKGCITFIKMSNSVSFIILL